jgi:hypothetical protein
MSLSQTWFQHVPEVHLYTDSVTDEEIARIYSFTAHSRLDIYVHPVVAHALVGTDWERPYDHSQLRHLLAMADLYDRRPGADWFLFGDDDTFVYPSALVDYISRHDPAAPQIHGRVFKGVDGLDYFFGRGRYAATFAQGGAGVVISAPVLRGVIHRLRDCAETFTSPRFVSDLRFAACLRRFFNDSEVAYIQCKTMMHNERPELMPPRTDPLLPLISYHRIVPPATFELWNATTSVWTDGAGVDRIADWAALTMFYQRLPAGSDDRLVSLLFGYRIFLHDFDETAEKNNSTKGWIRAITQIEPVFQTRDAERTKPIAFYQLFEKGIRIEYVCDGKLGRGEIHVDAGCRPEVTGWRLGVRCPEAAPFRVTNKGGRAPRNVTYEPENLW